jgi:hypothetical protein
MSKIIRPSETIHFAQDFQTNEMTVYGKIDAPVLDNMVTMIQPEYYRGWGINDPITDPNPYIQDFNAFAYSMSLYNGYIYQEGIVDYTTTQTYYTNSMTKYNNEIWISTNDGNIGNLPDVGGGFSNYTLIGSESEGIDNREPLIHMGNGYLVRYKTFGDNEFVLHQFMTGNTYPVGS